jgi:hypothetical protein
MSEYNHRLAIKILDTLETLKTPLNDEALAGMLSLLVTQAEALALANLQDVKERKVQ